MTDFLADLGGRLIELVALRIVEPVLDLVLGSDR